MNGLINILAKICIFSCKDSPQLDSAQNKGDPEFSTILYYIQYSWD